MENDQEQLTVQQRVKMWEEKAKSQGSSLDRGLCESPRKPPGVQGSCRTAIPSQGVELTVTSGEGQCERHMCDTSREPRCHVAEPMGDVCLARLRTHPQVLSMENLQGARDGLERCGELGEELGCCLDLALDRFCREPQCVQENARLLIRWDGGELEFISGQGQCEISVSCSAGEPQYLITEKTWDVFVAWTHSHPEPLSIKTLERVQTTLEFWGALEHWGALGEELRSCFGEAISQFSREPPCVQGNARMRIWWDGGTLEHLSGQGDCEIFVCYRDGRPQYNIGKLPVDMYVAWLHAWPDPLSADTLRRVWDKLGSCKGDSNDLRACFRCARKGFRQEPQYVQENARLLIQWGRRQLRFTSGNGECEISVHCGDGEPQYKVKIPVHVYVAQLRAHQQPLSADTLQRVLRELGSCHGDTDALTTCFERAWQGFRQEPRCVQENARLLIPWVGGELEFVSGKGQCEISVLLADGEPQYHITELGGDRPVTWSRTSPEPLSVANLARVRNRLGRWGALGEELRSCFGEAISQFSREPPCVQGNARMRIRWDGGTLELLSGEGQCEISVCYRDRRPQYEVGELPVHMYLARLRTHPEPLSAGTLRKVWDKLGSCKGDRDNLRACFLCAWESFHQEPRCVQDNARLLIPWRGEKLRFTSGKGECELTVSCEDGKPQYCVVKIPVHVYLARLRACQPSLSADTLQRVLRELGSCHGDTDALTTCFDRAWQGFHQEPQCVQENARLLIRWGRKKLEFVSGQGENLITVCKGEEGRFQYTVQVSGWWPWIARLLIFWKVLGRD